MSELILLFHGDLPKLLSVPSKNGEIRYPLNRRASIKDIIESLAIPHTEIGTLLVNGKEVDFSCLPTSDDRIEIFPQTPVVDVLRPTILRPAPLPAIAFAVDVNVAKLAPLLRMVGMDCWYENRINDRSLADLAHRQQRILLTRDTLLLKRNQVVYGHLVRAQNPEDQLREVIDLYGLRPLLNPFSRCMKCNGELSETNKERIYHLLETLTKKYYDTFFQCRGCGKIYWAGSHRQRMQERIRAILADKPINIG